MVFQDKEARIVELLERTERPMSAPELASALNVSRSTVLRWLARLVNRDVRVVGKGPATRYELYHPPELTKPQTEREYVGWNADWLYDYEPNETHYLTTATRAELAELGSPTSTLPAGTYARRILDRLLIDLSWNSSRLEGNTYTLLDTKDLLLRGKRPEGHSSRETQMVLNHKSAIEFIVENATALEYTPAFIRNIHALLAENLLADPAEEGRLRRRPVEISQSSYIPLANPQRIQDAFEVICAKANTIQDPFETAFFVLVHIPYLQPFVDVNKRVSRLAANMIFVRENYYPLSFLDVDRDEYLSAVLSLYESNDTRLLAEVFDRAYRRSAQKYAVIAQSLGEPDPLRLKYREAIKDAVGHVVRERVNASKIEETLESLELEVEAHERQEFMRVVREQLASLHEGNYARFRLRPSDFEAWKERDKPSK